MRTISVFPEAKGRLQNCVSNVKVLLCSRMKLPLNDPDDAEDPLRFLFGSEYFLFLLY